MGQLPFEITVLTLLAVLAASMWIPFIVGVNTVPEGSLPESRPDGFTIPADWRLHRPWVQRAYRAHQNLLEQLLPFGLLVLILDSVDGFNVVTGWTAAVFLGLRLAHAVGYITGTLVFPARPMVFSAGWICCLVMAGAVALA